MVIFVQSFYLNRAWELVIIFKMKLASLGKSSAFESPADAEYYNNMTTAKRKIKTKSLIIVLRGKKWISTIWKYPNLIQI